MAEEVLACVPPTFSCWICSVLQVICFFDFIPLIRIREIVDVYVPFFDLILFSVLNQDHGRFSFILRRQFLD